MYETPFTKENKEKVLADRSAPRDETHSNLKLIKIGHSGQRSPFALEVTAKDQFISRGFVELWDYLASAPAKKTEAAKQIAWFEEYANKRKNNNKLNNHFMLALEPLLRSYTIAIEAYMAMVSILYDIATNQLEGYKKIIDITNKLSTA